MTREIPLTRDQFALVDDEDYELVSQYNWHANWDDHTQGFYARRNVRRPDGSWTVLGMHSFLIGGPADHVNHDTLDNRRVNLRPTTKSQNQWNLRRARNNTSGYKGVSWHHGRWRARIRHHGVLKELGRYEDRIAAAIAYDNAARELFGEFACTNFPEKWVVLAYCAHEWLDCETRSGPAVHCAECGDVRDLIMEDPR